LIVANVIEIIIKASDLASSPLRAVAGQLDDFGAGARRVGQGIAGVGAGLLAATAPLIAGLGAAVSTSLEFSAALTNIRSLTGATTDEFAAMSSQLLAMGANSIAGPQAVAGAMYEIVSGVADASTHMAILESAIATSEAGAASLGGTTAALVSVMNAYRFGANKAAYASNVLTRTVGMGVGSMDEFAAAIPAVTGVAAPLGESFDNIGAQLAYMTTKGYTASVAATQIRSAFTSLLSPNAAMALGLTDIGVASGSAALEQFGLVGTYELLMAAFGGSVDEMAKATGSIESLQAVLALTGEGFAAFDTSFDGGLEGVTDFARGIQREGAAAQLQLLNSQMDALKISVGDALVPSLIQFVDQIKPVVAQVTAWVQANPALVAQIGQLVAGAVVLGVGLVALGTIISAVGFAVMGIGAAFAVLTPPVLLVISTLAALGAAFSADIGGIRTTALRILPQIVDAVAMVSARIEDLQTSARSTLMRFGVHFMFAYFRVRIFADRVVDALDELLASLRKFGERVFGSVDLSSIFGDFDLGKIAQVGQFMIGLLSPVGRLIDILKLLGVNMNLGETFISLVNGVTSFFDILGDGGSIFDALRSGFGGFVDNILLHLGVPAELAVAMGIGFQEGVNLIETAFNGVLNFIQTVALPGLQGLADWFTSDVLPGVVGFVQTTIVPGIQGGFDAIGAIWAGLQPKLQPIIDWFTETMGPRLVSLFNDDIKPLIESFTGLLGDIWTAVAPNLEALLSWFVETGLPVALNFISGPVTTTISALISLLRGIITEVRPYIDDLVNFITGNFELLIGTIERVIDAAGRLAGVWGGVSDNAGTVGNLLSSGQVNLGDVIGAAVGAIGAEFRANGGPVRAGSPYIVGERGSEMFIPSSSGRIEPNSGGGDSYVINIQLPAEAMASPERARAAGEAYGDGFMQQVRRQGGLG